ncbi:MAG: hypothetical protein JWP01_1887 [Myxococcales bacterium]|nr:hypothetical protein [Myxococcales bacterium]
MRLSSTFTLASQLLVLSVAACGGSADMPQPVDAAVKDIGFTRPTASLKANQEMSENNWVELGAADLSCLGTPSADVATANAIVVNTKVEDFQSGSPVDNATVIAFANQDSGSPFGAAVVSDQNADVSLMIPAGIKRFGYKMTHPNALDTLLLNQTLPSATMTPQTVSKIQSVSTATGATLAGLIGVSRTPGTGVLAGAVRDCQNREISNFIATVSSTPDVVTHIEGVDTYYFSASVGLPVRHSQQRFASKDGLFMAIEMSPTTTAYVQVWGYKTDADVTADNLTLIAQLKTQVIAETVITGSYDPLRTGL